MKGVDDEAAGAHEAPADPGPAGRLLERMAKIGVTHLLAAIHRLRGLHEAVVAAVVSIAAGVDAGLEVSAGKAEQVGKQLLENPTILPPFW